MTFDAQTLYLAPRSVFDAALVGYAKRPGDPVPLAIYDFASCVCAVTYWYDMEEGEATEYVSSHSEATWMGAGTPLILHPGLPEEDL
jgi:hypothetical protein